MGNNQDLYKSIFNNKQDNNVKPSSKDRGFLLSEIEKIRKKLLDLTTRNRLLSFKYNKKSLRIVDELPDQVFNTLVLQGDSMEFGALPEPDPESISNLSAEELRKEVADKADIDIKEIRIEGKDRSKKKYNDKILQTNLFIVDLETRLRRINSDAKSSIEETGQNQLYLALGFLEWDEKEKSDKKHSSPLILIPVELDRKIRKAANYIYYVKYTGEDLVENISLAEKLRTDFNLRLPKFDDDNVNLFEDNESVFDLVKYIKTVQNIIQDNKSWKTSWSIALGFFSFYKLLMYKDLDPNSWPEGHSIIDHHIIEQLILGKDDVKNYGLLQSSSMEEENIIKSLPLVLDADSSQISNIIKAMNGNNLVIQGPPGTGKSQTITNIISCFINEGKTVLFVAEKLAALKIVQQNLEKVGLDEFCLELHAHKARKREILNQLNKRIKINYTDTSELEYLIDQLITKRKALQSYIDTLHKTINPVGENLFQMIGKLEINRSEINDDNSIPLYKIDKIEQICKEDIQHSKELLDNYIDRYTEIGNPKDNIWSQFNSYKVQNDDDVNIIKSALHDINQIFFELLNLVNQMNAEFESYKLEESTVSISKLEKLLNLSDVGIPSDYDREIFIHLSTQNHIELSETINHLETNINDYNNLQDKISHDTSVKNEIADLNNIDDFITFIDKYCNDSSYKSVSISDLFEIPEIFEKTKLLVREILSQFEFLDETNLDKPVTINDINKTLNIIDVLATKPTLVNDLDTDYIFKFGAENYKEIITQIQSTINNLKENEVKFSKLFSLIDLPNRKELSLIRKSLRVHKGKFFSFLISDYRKAKNAVYTFLIDKSQIKSDDFIGILEDLDKFLTEKENFNNNQHYKKIFGHNFDGENTNIDNLYDSQDWINKLIDLSGSETLANKYVNNNVTADTDTGLLRDKCNNLEKYLNNILNTCPYSFRNQYPPKNNLRILNFEDIVSAAKNAINEIKSYDNFTKYIISPSNKLTQIKEAIENIITVNQLRHSIESNESFSRILGKHFDGINTNTNLIRINFNFLLKINNTELDEQLRQQMINGHLPKIIELLKIYSTRVSVCLNSINTHLNVLDDYGEFDIQSLLGDNKENVPISQIDIKFGQLYENIHQSACLIFLKRIHSIQ